MARDSNANDWPCPNDSCVNHHKMVFGSKASCPKCGAARDSHGYESLSASHPDRDHGSKGMKGGDMADDWPCPNQGCINSTKLVFGKRPSCPSCGAAREAKNPGDWLCPNSTCINSRNNVFAKKDQCPKCGTSRPNSRPGNHQHHHQQQHHRQHHQHQSPAMPARGQIVSMQMMEGPGGQMYAVPVGMQGGNGGRGGGYAVPVMQPMPMAHGGGRKGYGGGPPPPPPMPMQHGDRGNDWRCPNQDCMNSRKMVFGKHQTCPQCGVDKPIGNSRGGAPGDWQCPKEDCINHKNKVFAKHANCPNCGSQGPGRERSRSPRH